MSRELWAAVDDYLVDQLIPADPDLNATLAAADAAGLPSIEVSAAQGRLLELLARLCNARAILEIGTLAGYSTICLARGLLPGGRVITLEIDPAHAEVARANFARAGLADTIELRLGPAIDTLPDLVDHGPFDLVFIDANKSNNADYFTWALRMSRPGTLIVVDNVIRRGAVIDTSGVDVNVEGSRRVIELAGKDPRVTATAIQTVGAKGYDGLLVATVNAPGN